MYFHFDMVTNLIESDLIECLWFFIHDGVQWQESAKHCLLVPLTEVEAAGIVQCLVPALVTKNGNPDQLFRYLCSVLVVVS